MYDGKWFYVIIEDGKFIINNDPHNLDPKLSFLKMDDKKKKKYVLAITSDNTLKLNFVKIENNGNELHDTLNGKQIYQARVINLFDFLWQKEIAPSSSLFSLSVFLAMALQVL